MRIGFWVIAVGVVALDQWTKHLVQTHLSHGDTTPFLPGWLAFTYVQNSGVAFGQLRGAGPVLIVGALIAAAAIIGYRARLLRRGEGVHPLLGLGLSLPLGGAVGNLIDRARFGQVVDFIEIQLFQFPIFNVADIAITLGAAALMFYFGFLSPREAEHTRVPGPAPEMAE